MKEIGGYLELDTYSLPMLHEDAKALNCGRNVWPNVLEEVSEQCLEWKYAQDILPIPVNQRYGRKIWHT